MSRFWKFVLLLILVLVLAFLAYAYVGPWLTPEDFAAPQATVETPVTLETE